MNELRVKYELDEEIDQCLREIHAIVSKMVENKSPISETWITAKKLRKELEISVRTEQNWIKLGILKNHKIQGKNYYNLKEINELLSSNE